MNVGRLVIREQKATRIFCSIKSSFSLKAHRGDVEASLGRCCTQTVSTSQQRKPELRKLLKSQSIYSPLWRDTVFITQKCNESYPGRVGDIFIFTIWGCLWKGRHSQSLISKIVNTFEQIIC